MTVTRAIVADRLRGYLLGRWSLEEVVSWAEEVMAEGEIEAHDLDVIRDVVARLGLADVAAFGLTWEDVREMLGLLGYRPKVELEAMV